MMKAHWIMKDPIGGFSKAFECSNCHGTYLLWYWSNVCDKEECPKCNAKMNEVVDDGATEN